MNKVYFIIILVSVFVMGVFEIARMGFVKERARTILFGSENADTVKVPDETIKVPDLGTPAPKFVEPKIPEGKTGDSITVRYVDVKDASPSPPPNSKPVISAINVTQLHLNYEDVPHRYRLSATANDPDNNVPLRYAWSADCGFFPGSTATNPIEWHYNTSGECVDAKATVTVSDFLGAQNTFTQLLFPQ